MEKFIARSWQGREPRPRGTTSWPFVRTQGTNIMLLVPLRNVISERGRLQNKNGEKSGENGEKSGENGETIPSLWDAPCDLALPRESQSSLR